MVHCPNCGEGLLKNISDKDNGLTKIYQCTHCKNFIIKKYQQVSVQVYKHTEYTLDTENNLVSKYIKEARKALNKN